jgi:hypothetical protein
MKDVIIGIILSIAIIVFLEIFKSFNRKIMATLILVGIAFIYVGFVWQNIPDSIVVSATVLLFMLLSYYGYTRNFNLIILGLVLHGIWDVLFPYFSNSIPKGYNIFCVTVDEILAIYFYFAVSTNKKHNTEN